MKMFYQIITDPRGNCCVVDCEPYALCCQPSARMCNEGYRTWFVCVRSNLPPHTLESQKRDTCANRFIAIRERF